MTEGVAQNNPHKGSMEARWLPEVDRGGEDDSVCTGR